MDRSGIKMVMEEIGVRRSQIIDQPEWVMSPCPLAPWTHQSGRDTRASFGISVHEDDKSIFHCFTCHKRGTLVNLLERLEGYTGDDYTELKAQFSITEDLGPPLGEFGRRREREQETLGSPISSDYLRVYESPWAWKEARDYLNGRRISPSTCNRLQIQYDPDDRRILFPVFSTDGELYGFSGRAVDQDAEPRIKDYHGLPKRLLLLGSHLIGRAHYVMVVEGLFDYAWLQELGFPAVALMGTELTPGKAEILKQLGKPIYCFTDNDDPGDAAAVSIADQLLAHVPVFGVDYPPGKADGFLKDPAELSRTDIEMMIEDAELFDS